jgi:hypothetical protein
MEGVDAAASVMSVRVDTMLFLHTKWNSFMKARITVFAAAVLFTGAQAHAQSTQGGAPGNPEWAPQSTAAAPAAQWTPSYSSAAAGKTRAQVYQELVDARRSGELDRLNRTIYAHH